MNTSTNRKNFTLFIISILFVVLLFTLLLVVPPTNTYPVYTLARHWNLQTPAGTRMDVSLEEEAFRSVREGEVYLLQHTLPPEEVPAAGLRVRTNHSTLQVYVDGTLLYEDGAQYPPLHRMTPGRYHFVELPAGYGGAEIILRLTPNEDNAFTGFDPVAVGNIGDLYLLYIRSTRVAMIAGLFLCVMGVLLFLVFFFLNRYYGLEPRLLCSALISFLLGVYLLSYYKTTGLLSADYVRNDVVEYVALSFLPFSFVLFLATTQQGGRAVLFYILSAINYVAATALLVLHLLDMIFIDQYVPVIHLLVVAEGLLLIITMFVGYLRDRRKEEKNREWKVSEKIWVAGFFVMLLSAMTDIIRYSVLRYLTGNGNTFSGLNALTIGSLVFVATLILNFFYYHIEKVRAVDTYDRLSGLAYTDPLTDMANRGRCESVMQQVEQEGGPFTIISLDVDGLKKINDSLGHAAGDQYLAEMAAILNEVFKNEELVGRMGGDEFMALLRGNDLLRIQSLLRRLEGMLTQRNMEGGTTRYSISYGYATSNETVYETAKSVFRLADARMYAMKQKHHEREAGHA